MILKAMLAELRHGCNDYCLACKLLALKLRLMLWHSAVFRESIARGLQRSEYPFAGGHGKKIQDGRSELFETD
jgi:hypothetical protein